MCNAVVIKRSVLSWIRLMLVMGATGMGAQTPDIIRAEYMIMPRNDGGSKLDRMKFVVNIPIKVSDSNNIVIGSEYNRLGYSLERGDITMDSDGPVTLNVLDFNLAYIHRLGKSWRFVGLITPRLASTLTDFIGRNDLSLNASVAVFRDRPNGDRPTRLVLGISYNATVALRVPLPVIYYEKRFSPRWSYVVGAPKSGLKFQLDRTNQFQFEVILDGYYVHLQNPLIFPDVGSATDISSTAALANVGYAVFLNKSMSFYIFGGHTLTQRGVLRDMDRNNIFTLNDKPSLYFRTGFRIGL